jgi:hypothetical protein
MCLVYFPECSEEHYVIAQYLGVVHSEDYGDYDHYQWFGQYPKGSNTPLWKRYWHPVWYDGKMVYYKDTIMYPTHVPYTNDQTDETLERTQLVTWGFAVLANARVPSFILDRACEHAASLPEAKRATSELVRPTASAKAPTVPQLRNS